MGVELQLQGDKLTAKLSGDIDHHTGGKLREAIDDKAAQVRPRELVLDFAGVTFMDSSGIGLILGRYRWMQNLGGTVRVVHIAERMEQILLLSGINKLVRVESSKSAAEKEKMSEQGNKPVGTGHPEPREIFSDSSKEVHHG